MYMELKTSKTLLGKIRSWDCCFNCYKITTKRPALTFSAFKALSKQAREKEWGAEDGSGIKKQICKEAKTH